jgi:hypothetical protein
MRPRLCDEGRGLLERRQATLIGGVFCRMCLMLADAEAGDEAT